MVIEMINLVGSGLRIVYIYWASCAHPFWDYHFQIRCRRESCSLQLLESIVKFLKAPFGSGSYLLSVLHVLSFELF